MNMKIEESFLAQWRKYFDGAELPLVFYYSNDPRSNEVVKPPSGHKCIFVDLLKARTGKPVCFDADSLGYPILTDFILCSIDIHRNLRNCGNVISAKPAFYFTINNYRGSRVPNGAGQSQGDFGSMRLTIAPSLSSCLLAEQ